MDWSKNQLDAINATGGTILVSAAAGSGKTAVLVERIINKITNVKNNTNIDELLVVTFSNAAAAEIKERIAKKLDSLLLLQPYNKHLQNQQILLDSSHISTIHSFCQNLIRENFENLSIAPDFKIGQEIQINIFKHQAFYEIIDEFYKNPLFNELLKITDTTYNIDKLFIIINNFYNFLQSLPFPFDWLNKNLLMYKTYSKSDISDCYAAQVIFKYSLELLQQAKNILLKCKQLIEYEENNIDYINNFDQKLTVINSIISCVNITSWDKVFEILKDYNVDSLPRAKKSMDTELKQQIKNLHDKFKDIIKNLKTNYFPVNKKDFALDMEYTYNILKLITTIINNFVKKFNELKKAKNLLDFSDLEQLTIKLLLTYDGELCKKTNKATIISNNFKEIFIDEYQDTNLTQEYIFKAISKNETNLFMVGDSKQSIYRFRQAKPELFIEKSKKYNLYNNSNFPAKIILSQNFRSRKSVTSFVNFIFEQLMSSEIGEIIYDETQKLISSVNYPPNENDITEIHILKTEDNLIKEEAIYNEAEYIAKKIKQMVNNKHKITKNGILTDVTYGDFCILMRSPNEKIKFFIKAFNNLNIPLLTETNTNFFETKEISTIISFLKTINNPLDDISTISVMLSEIFNFSIDDILKLKQKYNTTYVFQALREDAANNNTKSKQAYNTITYYKNLVNILPLSKLLQKIYDETDFYNIVRIYNNGKERQTNLDIFKNLVKDITENEENSLTEFISYINNLIEQKIYFQINNVKFTNNNNYVKIMSIHKSKGLEFPICILADTNSQINQIDVKSPILLHPDIGFGINKFDKSKNVKYSTLPKNALKLEIEKNMLSEELRILYVALTRAKEKLIIIINNNNFNKRVIHWNELLSINSTFEKKIPPYLVKQVKCYEDFFILSLLRHPQLKVIENSITCHNLVNFPSIDIKIHTNDNLTNNCELQNNFNKANNTSKTNNNIINLIKKNIDYAYPYTDLTKIPSKLGVSDIVKKELNSKYAFEKRPKIFYKNGLTSAEKGNIIHKFMQFSDYNNAKNNINLECERLLKLEFISKEEYDNLDRKKLSDFFNSKLYHLIESSKKIHREVRFVYPIAIKQLSYSVNNNKNNIIVQGVADCVIENEKEIIIIDYKTDKINNINELAEKYKSQLLIYQQALSKIFYKPSNKAIIYSFCINKYCVIK